MTDEEAGYAWLIEGRRLHMRRRWASAERAYREGIAAGRTDGWLLLGLLLQPWPGREQEAKAAFRAAMADDHLSTRTRAASELGLMLARLDHDLEGARDAFEYAAEHGSGRGRETARVALGHVHAAMGDRAAAAAAFRSVYVTRFKAGGLQPDEDDPLHFADAIAGLVLRPRVRQLAAARYRLGRVRRRLIPGR